LHYGAHLTKKKSLAFLNKAAVTAGLMLIGPEYRFVHARKYQEN
jgi:hypothetical protein